MKESLKDDSNVPHVISTKIPATETTPLFIHKDNDSSSVPSNKIQSLIAMSKQMIVFALIILFIVVVSMFASNHEQIPPIIEPNNDHYMGNIMVPFSTENPVTSSLFSTELPYDSKPSELLLRTKSAKAFHALPTNSWCENMFIGTGYAENNKVYQIPYIVDAAGSLPGIRIHATHIIANNRLVEVAYESENGIIMSAVEPLQSKFEVANEGQQVLGRLILGLKWLPDVPQPTESPSYSISTHIARGSPYVTTFYSNATPRIRMHRSIKYVPLIDGDLTGDNPYQLECGENGEFSEFPVRVKHHIQLSFAVSDMSWMIFFSEPVEVVCTNFPFYDVPGGGPPTLFELKTTKPLADGIVRVALMENCVSGLNPANCVNGKSTMTEDYRRLVIKHSNVYPSLNADVTFQHPVDDDYDKYIINFDWKPKYMNGIDDGLELLTLAIPHQQELLVPNVLSSNKVILNSCVSILYGDACAVVGSVWSIEDVIYPTTFGNEKGIYSDMIPDIRAALSKDIHFELPKYYANGAGDTYFSGKMLARLGRTILLADRLKSNSVENANFQKALIRLQQNVEVWFNGSAVSPFMYDADWGGLLNCGCDFNGETQDCNNKYPNCPGLMNSGLNFGFSFYNDHHFHLGYHIFAAAVVSKYNPDWGRKNFEKVLLYIRDIANPSPDDPYFFPFRNTDFYLGFAWASGIAKYNGEPYPVGRNWESSSEAVSAYEAIALYGQVMAIAFEEDDAKKQRALHIETTGKLLTSITIRAVKSYYHVKPANGELHRRFPAAAFEGAIVGMMWSLKLEQQTWFGNEVWKSYGIQMIPLTQISLYRDSREWLREMIPLYNASCLTTSVCSDQGFSVSLHAANAVIGNWRDAWRGIMEFDDSVFNSAGGNGHSKSNTLWFIATQAQDEEIF